MKPSIFITHGRTESGDDITMLAWSQEPCGAAISEAYRDILSEEIDAFGEDFVMEQIELTEVQWAS